MDWEDRVGTWFNLATDYDLQGWELGAQRENSRLLHRSCPWGGRLVRLEVPNVHVLDAPEDPSYLLVRPEVRSLYTSIDSLHCEMCSDWVNTFTPGDAMIKQGNTMPLLRLAALLFGDMSVLQSFDGYNTVVVGRQRLRRDFPEAGDCTYLFEDTYGNAQEYLLTMRRQGQDLFSAVCTFSTPLELFHDWFSPFFPLLLDEMHRVLQRYVNRPGIKELRLADANFYITLSLRNFNRGPPMIPQSTAHEKTVTIHGGEDCRWSYWMPFAPGKRFSCAKYIQRFFEELGVCGVATYDVLDGKKLVPYQCVMPRRQWMKLRENFLTALKWQKMAYRFRHGGTTAPSLVEDVAPRVASMELHREALPQVQNPIAKVVVRKTFLELEDDVPCSKLIENVEGAPGNLCLKRSKSACGDILNFSVQYYSLM